MTSTDFDLSGKTALVTGGSRGIGYAAALCIAKAGAHVVALARTTGGLEELDNEILAATGQRATLVPLDITDYDALDRLGEALYQRFGKLDILVGNAAQLHPLSPLGHIKPKEFERTVGVNLIANWRLLRSMDPLLRAAPKALAIFMTDGIAHAPQAFWSGYAATKAGLEAMAKSYAAEVGHTNVRVELVDPGVTDTKLRRSVMPNADISNQPKENLLYPLLDKFFN
ncbi:MAG: SDR family oxidoreductase [Pseudomonadota bacterium]